MNRLIHYKLFLLLTCSLLISQVSADDYYWIGGSGNWSDINHWAQSSGGSVLHIQIPTSEDNVFFDKNSFSEADQTVTLNTENAICKSMDWTGANHNPTFYCAFGNNLRVYGSLTLIQNMNHNFDGTYSFESTTSGNTIKLNGKDFNSHIIFDGIGGSWTLLDSLLTLGNIYFKNGNINTNSQNVYCSNFFSSEATERTLNISNSLLYLNASFILGGKNLELSAGNSHIITYGDFTCISGDTLNFNDVTLPTGGTVNVQDVYANFQNILFEMAGSVDGTCFSDSISFINNASGSIIDQVSINELIITGAGSISGNNHILYATVGGACQIQNSNWIDHITIVKYTRIFGSNVINKIIIQDTAVINSSNQIGKIRISKTAYYYGNNTTENAYLNADGFFYGENIFDTLSLSSGCRYFLEHGKTQTINNTFNAEGNCTAPIFIKSDYNGLAATFQKTNGNINADYLSLRDIHCNGTGTFTAENSVDLGNNDGWNIETSGSKDLYWVNGSGDWDDPAHWSLSSGGSPGACPPTEIDNAFFDGASFNGPNEVFINTKIAVCRDMDWTGSASNAYLTGADTNFLKIYGSLTFSNAMDNQFPGEVHFEATEPNQFIDASGKRFNNDVRIQGRGGAWRLEDVFQVTDTLFHDEGFLTSNHYNIITGKYNSIDTNYRKLYLNQDTVFINDSSKCWQLNAHNLELDADSSVLVFNEMSARMRNFNGFWLIFNNVHFKGVGSTMSNMAYSVYNLITFDQFGRIRNNATIDTAIFYNGGLVTDADTIKTVMFYGFGTLEGNHIVEIAYYFEEGEMAAKNKVDTAYFYQKGTIYGANIVDTTIIYGTGVINGRNRIRTATLEGKGFFKGHNFFNDLFLAVSRSYSFGKNDTTTVIDTLLAMGRCTGPIFLISDEKGSASYLEKENGSIFIDFANMRDMHALGEGIPFQATNTVDLGGNENWDFYQPEAKALYWVGNSGNWSDSLHWAPVSGGEPGYCIPTPIDDVYFDENSFTEQSTVTINVDIAACHHMNWTGAKFEPKFTGDDSDLYIFGSLFLNPVMEFSFEGDLYFSSPDKGEQIRTDGNQIIAPLFFEGRGGSWYLQDALFADNVTQLSGDLFSQGNKLTFSNSFISMEGYPRGIFLDTSFINIGLPNQSGNWILQTDSLTLDADSTDIVSYGYVSNIGNSYSQNVVYDDILFKGNGGLACDSVYGYFDDITFEEPGSVSGWCTIDTLLFMDIGNVTGSDTINYSYFKGDGSLAGGHHVVNTALFFNDGTISGNCEVKMAIFNASGLVSDSNIIDTTIFYLNGFIQGSNIFKSKVLVHGNANISGTNVVQKDLIIHGVANIFEENNIYNALLLNWGYIGGYNQFNTLTLTPGKTYTLTANTTQTIIDTLNIRGNNCFPITLKSSSTQHVQAGIYMETGEVSGDFIVMKDIDASGDALFYAGGHSDNIINNTGWIWDNAPGYIYGLGADTAFLCDGQNIVLSTENFNGNNNTIYEWFDGTISPTYLVSQPGDYGLMVYYSDNCAVPGSIRVEGLPSPELDLGPDAEICEGTIFELPVSTQYASYLWSTGSTWDTIEVNQSGNYWLEVTNAEGCTDTDEITLNVIPAPQVDLGQNLILHNDESVVLDAGYPNGGHIWSTGDTTQTIAAYGVEGGAQYWVEVEYAGCFTSDSIWIDEYPYCIVDIPTAFTPNGDGVNDTLFVVGSGIQTLDFKLFNRYGELIFETNDISKGWDGNYFGTKQEQEVYVFYLKAICFDGLITEKKGNITLMR